MHLTLLSCSLFFLFPAISHAQTIDAAPKPSESKPSNPTYKTIARQVVVDVVVAGAKGEVLAGLKQSDFAVLEDGKPQTLSFFEEHTGVYDPLSGRIGTLEIPLPMPSDH
jgi:hypothetical protein